MRINRLSLEQFRSHERLFIDFSAGDVHVIIGENGIGKTNIVEAIGLLSLSKSPQGFDEADLFRWGQTFYRVQAAVETQNGEESTVEVASQLEPRRKKVCRRNDVELAAGQFIGSLPTVFFFPQELDLFTGSPQQRRAFLDQLLCQVSPEYIVALTQYNKILKQRNQLLRAIAQGTASSSQLSVWNQQLAAMGATVTVARLELLQVLQCTLANEIEQLGELWTNCSLSYQRKTTATTAADIATEHQELLQRSADRDIAQQATSSGPHRDDWQFLVDDRDVATFASRGQQRTAILALLFLRVSFIELKRGERPLIVMDDVFSELDYRHQCNLLAALQGHQVILTSTHAPEAEGAVIWSLTADGLTPATTLTA